MNKYATKQRQRRVVVWVIWLLVVLASLMVSGNPVERGVTQPLLGVVSHDASRSGPLFPWQPCGRWKQLAWRKYCAWRAA